MKIRAGGGNFRATGGALGQQGAPPCYSSLWETLLIWGFDGIKYLFSENIYHKSSINMHMHVDQNLPFFVLNFCYIKLT